MNNVIRREVGRRSAHLRPGSALMVCGSALLLSLVLAPVGCKRTLHRVQTEEASAPTASTILMGDPKLARQLVGGFHGIEARAWRWTAQQFTVDLKVPAGAAQKGAALVVKVTVPPVVIEKEKSITLSSSISGAALPPETWSQTGNYTYRRDVPASQLTGTAARVDFQLDKAIPPSGGDQRQLGIVVLSIGLEAK